MRFLLFLPLAFAGNSPRVDFDPALAAAKVPEWEAACEKNSGEACGNLGALFALGKGVSQKIGRAHV